MRYVLSRQHVQIQPSHRGIGVQLRDAGNMSTISFQNITLTAHHDVASWWGGGEAISVSSLRRNAGQHDLGHIRGISFRHVQALAEVGIVLVGEPDAALAFASLDNVHVRMSKLTTFPGGHIDLRPSPIGQKQLPANALFVENVVYLAINVRSIDTVLLKRNVFRADWSSHNLPFPRHLT